MDLIAVKWGTSFALSDKGETVQTNAVRSPYEPYFFCSTSTKQSLRSGNSRRKLDPDQKLSVPSPKVQTGPLTFVLVQCARHQVLFFFLNCRVSTPYTSKDQCIAYLQFSQMKMVPFLMVSIWFACFVFLCCETRQLFSLRPALIPCVWTKSSFYSSN